MARYLLIFFILSPMLSEASFFNWGQVGVENGKPIIQDLRTKILWYPAFKEEYRWSKAKEKCLSLNLRLPRQEDFDTAEMHGIRGAISDFKNRSFWSSTQVDAVFAIGYNSKNGMDYYDAKFTKYSVRCIGSFN